MGLAVALKESGIDVGVWKPLMSGSKRDDPNSDALLLKQMSGDHLPLKKINPFQFDEPLSPYLAAKRAGETVTRADIVAAWNDVVDDHQYFIVEGAGGLMSPLGEQFCAGHIAADIGLPLLIVARPGLGTVNHTLLTIEQARRFGLTVAGVVINGVRTDEQTVAEQTNPQLIEQFSHVPIIGEIPWLDQLDRDTLLSTINKNVSMITIFN